MGLWMARKVAIGWGLDEVGFRGCTNGWGLTSPNG
jgi:hypothetical protein